MAFPVAFLSLVPVTVASVACQAGGDDHNCQVGNTLVQTRTHKAKEISVETQDAQSSWTWAVAEKRHIDYDGVRDKKRQLDIYWPKWGTPPAGGWLTVVAVHGMGSSKATFRTLCQVIAMTGRLCVSTDYRDNTKVMKDDTSRSVDWLIEHASTYNIDKNRIIIYGQSRGGFITGNLLVNRKYNPSRFAGSIITMGVGVGGDKSQTAKKIAVPLLVITAENDRVVLPSGAKSLVAEMQKLGSDVTFVLYESAGHNPRQGAGSMYEHMSNFLRKFETEPPPTVYTDDMLWPQMGQKLKCYVSESVEIHGLDQAECQAKANEHGHRYIQYYAPDKICATAATCDDAIRFANGWQVFWRPQGPEGSVVPVPPPPPQPAVTPVTPSLPDPAPAPAPAPGTSELCTASTSNAVWNHDRCQERCGNAGKCGSTQTQCAKFCAPCPCA